MKFLHYFASILPSRSHCPTSKCFYHHFLHSKLRLMSSLSNDSNNDISEQSLSLDREVITIGLGCCGNRMSTGFWRTILKEHNLNLDGTLIDEDEKNEPIDNTRIGTFFREMKDIKNKYVARNIICDLDATTIDSIQASDLQNLFSADQYIFAGNSANNLFSLGYNSLIIDAVVEEIRIETEKCSSFQGFNVLHSIGGGTGSGLTAYLCELLRDEYNDRIISSYTVYPSDCASDSVIEPYNMMLSMPSLLNYHTMNNCIDNETLYDISSRLYHQNKADTKLKDLNEFIFNIISSSTAGLRFKGSMNMDLRKLATNLLPFPRLKFLSISDAPLMYAKARQYTKINIERLVTELFHSHQFLSGINENVYDYQGKYLAASCIFRGSLDNSYNIRLNEWEIANGLRKTMREIRENGQFLRAIPRFLHSTLIYSPSPKCPLTATLFANNIGIKELFVRNMSRFEKFFKRKAFLHYFTNNGTLEEDFEEAMNDTNDLLEEYADKNSYDAEDIDEKELYNEFMQNLPKNTANSHKFQRLKAMHNAKKTQTKNHKKKTKKQILREQKKLARRGLENKTKYYEPWRDPKRKVIRSKKASQMLKKQQQRRKGNGNKKKKIKEESEESESESDDSSDDFEEESTDSDNNASSSSSSASASSQSSSSPSDDSSENSDESEDDSSNDSDESESDSDSSS